jgi:predicted nucleic acid-binding protein
MLVVDTSAVLGAIAGRPANRDLIARLTADPDLHAPHLIDLEILHALRRLVHRGELSDDRAADARSDFADLSIVRYPHRPLADRIWELRENLTAYEAAFVSLSEAMGVPLITCDAHLALTSGHRATIELFSPDQGTKYARGGGRRGE